MAIEEFSSDSTPSLRNRPLREVEKVSKNDFSVYVLVEQILAGRLIFGTSQKPNPCLELAVFRVNRHFQKQVVLRSQSFAVPGYSLIHGLSRSRKSMRASMRVSMRVRAVQVWRIGKSLDDANARGRRSAGTS